jgi:fatty acid desaturase
VHWKHHLNLGDDGDTEISYLNPISLSQMLFEFLGINAMRSVLRYFDASAPRQGGAARSKLFIFGLLLLLAVQAAVILGLFFGLSPAAGLSWALAFWVVTPLCNKLRQTMEHRSMYAGNLKLLSPKEQGPVNRLFGSDWFSSKFGDAGFNRHLLHHWDPAISYTRVPEMEAFFLDSDLRQVIEKNKTTYLKTFMVLAA